MAARAAAVAGLARPRRAAALGRDRAGLGRMVAGGGGRGPAALCPRYGGRLGCRSLKLGYPAKNTLFWQPRRALLVQNGQVAHDFLLDSRSEQLCEILRAFFAYTEPVIADWERATGEFRDRVAEFNPHRRSTPAARRKRLPPHFLARMIPSR